MDEEILLVHYGRLPGLNEMVNANRTCWYMGAKMKKGDQRDIAADFLEQARGRTMKEPCTVRLDFYEKDNRRDDDNVIGGGCKVILDALTKAGIIMDDSPKWVHVLAERHTCLGAAADREKAARIEVDLIPQLLRLDTLYAVMTDGGRVVSIWDKLDKAKAEAERKLQYIKKEGGYYWVDAIDLNTRHGAHYKPLYEAGKRPAWM